MVYLKEKKTSVSWLGHLNKNKEDSLKKCEYHVLIYTLFINITQYWTYY